MTSTSESLGQATEGFLSTCLPVSKVEFETNRRLEVGAFFFTTPMRPVISYDDITLPYEMTSNTTQEAITPTVVRHDKTPVTKPSSKKRKRKSRHSSSGGNAVPQVNGYDDEDAEYLEVEESRELTHSEIWDDSALIDAWNAAAEEYKVGIFFFS